MSTSILTFNTVALQAAKCPVSSDQAAALGLEPVSQAKPTDKNRMMECRRHKMRGLGAQFGQMHLGLKNQES